MGDQSRPLSGVLHHAIATGDISKVEALLKQGVCANAPIHLKGNLFDAVNRRSMTNSISSRQSTTGSVLDPINESTPQVEVKCETKLSKADIEDDLIKSGDEEEHVEGDVTDYLKNSQDDNDGEKMNSNKEMIDDESLQDAEDIINSLTPQPVTTFEFDQNDNNNRKSIADVIDEKLNDDNETLIERNASIKKTTATDSNVISVDGICEEKPKKLLPRIKRKISIKWRKTKKEEKEGDDVDDDDMLYENMPTAVNVDDEQLNENYEGIAFFDAVRDGMDMIVQTLLETSNNYQLDEPDEDGFTPAMQAAWHGQKDCLQILLDHGANITQANATGCTAAHFAAGQGHLECLKMLIEDGDIDVDTRTKFGATALILAAKGGHTECVEFLLEHKADPNIQYRGNQNSLLFAAGNGHYDCIQALMKWNVHLDQPNSQGVTSLMRAVQQGHITTVVLLIDSGANLDMQDVTGRTAAHFAVEHNNTKALKLLLQAGAIHDKKTKGGSTPLNYAERFQNAKCSELLEQYIKTLKEKGVIEREVELQRVKEEQTTTCMLFKNIFRRKARSKNI